MRLGNWIRSTVLTLGALAGMGTGVLPAQWQPAGTMPVTPRFYTFLATTPSGDLLAATFNRGEAEKAIPAVLIRQPMSQTPQEIELCSVNFDKTRGFGGIACDSEGNFFVSGDTGDPTTCFVRRFLADGTPDTRFGNGGVILPQRRCLGVEALGKYLFVAVDWSEILIMDTATGADLGKVAKPQKVDLFMRDIAIDPKSLRLFGVGQGAILTWGGGTPWAPDRYIYRELKAKSSQPMVGEGIAMDPFRRCVLIVPPGGGEVQEVFGTGAIIRSAIEGVEPKSSLTDAAVSFDGTTLFVSDYVKQRIYVMRRQAPVAAAAPGGYAALPVDPKAAPVAPPKWEPSYTAVMEQARAANKPMLVYFRSAEFPASRDFEKKVVLTPDFNRRAQGFTCVFEDASKNRLLAYRFGVARVPYLVLFNAKGETVAEFGHPIDPLKLFAAMEALKQ